MDRVQPRLIMQFGVGLESVDREAAAARGIAVDNIPASNAGAVGEVAVMHLLALTRRLHTAGEAVAAAKLGQPVGVSLLGKRVVVIGRGAVGRAVAERLAGFGVELRLLGSAASADLPAALAGANAVIVCCRLDETTRGMLDAAALAAMEPDSYLVNVARGPIVDYDALLAALRSGQLAGAGLDVFWEEPIDPADPLLAENVSVTPHVGGVSQDSYRDIAERFVAKVEALRATA
jgi:phosphoglycerate dehydrogenase-like enzyme